MTIAEWFNRVNARSRRVPVVLLKLLLAWFLSAVVLALLMPALQTGGISLRGWMVWTVSLASLVLCIGPDLRGRWRRR